MAGVMLVECLGIKRVSAQCKNFVSRYPLHTQAAQSLSIGHRERFSLPFLIPFSIQNLVSPIMTRASPQTWLEKLEEQLNVDVDWMDPTYSKNLPIKPNDQTSNNLWVNQQMSHPENKEMVLQVCKELKSEGWKAAYTRIVSLP
jgi:hypothetical protein